MKTKLMIKTFFKVMIGNQKEIENIIPKAYFKSIYDINYQKLKEKGITCLLFDIDGTIAEVDNINISNKTKKLFENLKDFKILLISNNGKERVLPVSQILNIPAIYLAGKPKSSAYDKALKLLKTKKENTCMIGDQILTDITGANKYGIYSILIDQISNKNNIQTSLAQNLQILMIKKLQKKKLFNKGKFYMN